VDILNLVSLDITDMLNLVLYSLDMLILADIVDILNLNCLLFPKLIGINSFMLYDKNV
jgi:hypothetical protein